jgi:Putative transposase
VLAYLGRYTHRVAIANSRLVTVTENQVAFRWKDHRHHGKSKVMALDADAFTRRFLLHTLPDGFHRIRHSGFLANGQRAGSWRSAASCWLLHRQSSPRYRPSRRKPSSCSIAAPAAAAR